MLSDEEIHKLITRGTVGFTPYDPALVNPASVDMTLDPNIRIPAMPKAEVDMRAVREGYTVPVKIDPEGPGFVIYPGQFLLASTVERVTLPPHIVARVEGKSSIGRVGLAVHITAGFIDPGFEGQVTLEIANLAPWPIRLHAGMRIAQVAFQYMNHPVKKPYGRVGHYQGQSGPVESRYCM